MKSVLLFLTLAMSTQAFAWGGRGHDALCRAAVFLVKEPALREYLQYRPHMMGHLCNIPDIAWRNQGPEIGKVNGPTHYVDSEILGMLPKDVSLDYQGLMDKSAGQDNKFKAGKKIQDFPSEFGSLWWRADQFYRMATGLGDEWKKEAAPTTTKEESDDNFPYNKSTYQFIVDLGLMGHFVGDASMPFHASADYDGYETGHGGIHSYYEDAGVAAIGPDLEVRIVNEGKKLQAKPPAYLTAPTVLERLRALSDSSYPEMKKVLAIDKVSKASEKGDGEKGKHVPAVRPDVKEVAAKFQPLIISELARSAVTLAKLWDEAYEKVGKPELSKVRLYKYPLSPEFVPPDYYKASELKAKTAVN